MKKMIAMILALACIFSFAACASKKTDDTIGAESLPTTRQQRSSPLTTQLRPCPTTT